MLNLKGGEKLLLVSDWNEIESCKDTSELPIKLPTTTYQMILNGKIINLIQLNRHVLECTLPEFPIDMGINDQTSNVINTNIFIYENQFLFCAPIPFEIKRPNLSKISNSSMEDYRNHLILFERVLVLFQYYGIEKFQLNYFIENEDHSSSSSFERRLCRLLDTFVKQFHDLVYSVKINAVENFNSMLKSSDFLRAILNTQQNGKTLMHSTAELGLNDFSNKLDQLRQLIMQIKKDNQLIDLGFIEDELNVFNMDQNGNTPLVNV